MSLAPLMDLESISIARASEIACKQIIQTRAVFKGVGALKANRYVFAYLCLILVTKTVFMCRCVRIVYISLSNVL